MVVVFGQYRYIYQGKFYEFESRPAVEKPRNLVVLLDPLRPEAAIFPQAYVKPLEAAPEIPSRYW